MAATACGDSNEVNGPSFSGGGTDGGDAAAASGGDAGSSTGGGSGGSAGVAQGGGGAATGGAGGIQTAGTGGQAGGGTGGVDGGGGGTAAAGGTGGTAAAGGTGGTAAAGGTGGTAGTAGVGGTAGAGATDAGTDSSTGGCQTNFDCNDDDVCTGQETCVEGRCIPGIPLDCDDANDCTNDTCDQFAGCQRENLSGTVCSNGNACTENDVCSNGVCQAGNGVNCDDSNPCTNDSCVPATGCLNVNNTQPCNDGNACTQNDRCGAGTCSGAAVSCDDGDDCTGVTCDPASGCTYPPLSGTACDDGDACTTGTTCTTGSCGGGSNISCDDGNVCTDDSCNPSSGCVHGNNTQSCDDSNGCTSGDVCGGGSCAGTGSVNCDDGNPCTADSCTPGGGCQNTAVSDGVSCPSDGNPCTLDTCLAGACHTPAPASTQCRAGACSLLSPPSTYQAVNPAFCDGTTIDCPGQTTTSCSGVCNATNTACEGSCGTDTDCSASGTYCSTGGTCVSKKTNGQTCGRAGECTSGNCVDGYCCNTTCGSGAANSATDCRACNLPGSLGACTNLANNTSCSDANACSVGEFCTNGSCGSGSANTCDDSDPCTTGQCDPTTGCSQVPGNIGGACSDGDSCTIGDTCSAAGACTPGAAKNCDDGNPCTDDSCGAGGTCTHTNNTASCNDGDPCTVGDTCGGGTCQAGTTPLACNDGNPCTNDVCVANIGCTFPNNTSSCNDGNPCTTVDTCSGGSCVGTTPRTCNDGNACTDDSCDPVNGDPTTGCRFVNDDTNACNDGNFCTSNDACSAGTCAGTSAVTCEDNNPCTDNVCNPGGGCSFPFNTASCDDGNACTTADECFMGSCTGGPAPDCNDGNVCTNDSCVPETGCLHTNNAAGCSDGNACTTGDVCSGGSCQPGLGALACDDGNPCTDNNCVPATGCDYPNNTAPCSDNSVCTTGDVCSGGSCQPGTALDCEALDGEFCNGVSTCDPIAGCQPGTPIDCTGNDAVDCTLDRCDEVTDACVSEPLNSRCDDGLFCNGVETCDLVNDCQPGTAVVCDDLADCTTDSCNETTNACDYVASDAYCQTQDADVCNGAEMCDAGSAPCTVDADCAVGLCDTGRGQCESGCVAGSPLVCNDGVGCTDDSCDSVTGCAYAANDANCDDGLFCNGAEVCNLTLDCQDQADPVCDPDGDNYTCTTRTCSESSLASDHCEPFVDNAACAPFFCAATGSPGTGCAAGAACTVDADCGAPADHDGLLCNGEQICNNNVCEVAQAPVNCGDGVACTDDACVEPSGDGGAPTCQNTPNDGNCADTACTTGVCNATLGCQASPINCDDGIDCTVDYCGGTGCVHQPTNSRCDNGTFCDGAETCLVLSACTSDGDCGGAGACVFDASGKGRCYDELRTCSVDADCVSGTCAAGFCTDGCTPAAQARTCAAELPTDIPCTVDECDPGTDSCVHRPDNSVCKVGCDTNADCVSVGGTCNLFAADKPLKSSGPPATYWLGACTATCGLTCNPSGGLGPYGNGCGSGCQENICAGNKPYLCGDCIDNDGDCRVDLADPECFGICDNNEGGFKGDIPGQGGGNCTEECYFDSDSGNGNDGCEWDFGCDPESQAAEDPHPGSCICTPLVGTCNGGSCSYACTANTQCPINSTCVGNVCTAPPCAFDTDCVLLDAGATCEPVTGCAQDSDCPSGGLCDTQSGLCSLGECATPSCGADADCKICASSQACRDNFQTQATFCYDPTVHECTSGTCGNSIQACTGFADCLKVDGWDACGSVTPNGCDCFGCCAVPDPSSPGEVINVYLGSEFGVDPDGNGPLKASSGSCSMDELNNELKCKRCTQVESCINPCETCELCIGKPTLPPECGCQVCEQGQQQCTESGAPCGSPCPTGFFCKTGCCAPNPG